MIGAGDWGRSGVWWRECGCNGAGQVIGEGEEVAGKLVTPGGLGLDPVLKLTRDVPGMGKLGLLWGGGGHQVTCLVGNNGVGVWL